MPIGLVGRKAGMTRLFTDTGESISVTVVVVEPNRVTRLKTQEKDGYRAVQLTAGSKKPSRLSKPQAGHLAKTGVEAGGDCGSFAWTMMKARTGSRKYCRRDSIYARPEDRCDRHEHRQGLRRGGQTTQFPYPGCITREFTCTPCSRLDRPEPDTGACFQGQADGWTHGCRARTVQNLEIVQVDETRNAILIKGAVPGPRGGRIIVRPAVKAR